MLKDRRGKESSDGSDHVEQIVSLLDEDHLEFEELLLHIQKTTETLTTQLKKLTEELTEFRAEALESREMLENLDAKVDRLMALVAEFRRDSYDQD